MRYRFCSYYTMGIESALFYRKSGSYFNCGGGPYDLLVLIMVVSPVVLKYGSKPSDIHTTAFRELLLSHMD